METIYIILLISLFFNWRLWLAYSTDSDLLNDNETLIEEFQESRSNMFRYYTNVLEKMRQMDKIKAYEFNDELGIFFKFIKDMLEDLSEFHNKKEEDILIEEPFKLIEKTKKSINWKKWIPRIKKK